MKKSVTRVGLAITSLVLISGTVRAQAILEAEAAKPDASLKALETQVYASDEASAIFYKESLPDIAKMLSQSLGESKALKNTEAMALDPEKLLMKNASDIRVYFVGEGAGYYNTLGFNLLGSMDEKPKGAVGEDAKIIFDNASSVISTYGTAPTTVKRTPNAPLLPGDFVDLGEAGAGSFLDFFLIADGARGGKYTYTADANRNPDGRNHVVAFALPDSPYLILGFEDLYGGGDMDYNDVLFAVDIGVKNVRGLVGAPEPGAWAILGGFLLIAARSARRRLTPAGA